MTSREVSSKPAALGVALSRAITQLRETLGDPIAPITVIVPAGPNGVLARRALALECPILRVWFETPAGLLAAQTPATFWRDAEPEPAGWFEPTLGDVLARLAERGALGRFGAQLVRPGWRAPIARALARLESEGVGAPLLRAVRDAHAGTELAERLDLLAVLVEALAHTRDAARIAAPSAVLEAAIAAIDATLRAANGAPIEAGAALGVAAARARGAVILGDKELPHREHTFLAAWLAARPVVRVSLPATRGLAIVPLGLAATAPSAPVVDVEVEGAPEALAAIHARLFTRTPSDQAVEVSEATGVVFARTPDDVREPAECVRVVMRAALDGTPLDRIAIVLPDGAERGPLEQALDDAGIPATWFVGGPARELMPARLLRVAIDVAAGDATPRRLYELLGHPALDLRRVLGADALKGRGRWRRLLSSIRGARGLTRIVRGLEALPPPDGAPEELEREATSRTSLLASLGVLIPALEALDVSAPLGAHVRAFARFLGRFARRSEARNRLLALLEPYGRTFAGPHLPLSAARTELDAILGNELPRGALTERSVRVLSPMHLVGAELDVVCLLGLTEGRFPTERHEDALLPDHLLTALSEALGRTLSSSRAHEDVERRRFAAVVGATRRSLWLSSPALDFETERPALPSSLALAALSACLGRRTTYGELAKHQVRAGSRARVFTEDPDEALGEAEHLLSRVHRDPAALLTVLASHPTSRGLLQLHSSMKRVADGGPIDAWTGLVPREVLSAPGLDGRPVRLGVLETMIDAPATLFFRHMLDAWAPARLEPWGPPLDPPAIAAHVADAAHGDVITEPAIGDVIHTRVKAALTDALELGAFTREELDEVAPVIRALSASLVEAAEGYLRASPEDPAGMKLATDLPWTLAELRGRRVVDDGGTTLVDVVLRQKNKTKVADEQRALALSALALEEGGTAVDAIAVVRPDGGGGREELAKFVDALLGELRAGTVRTEAGVFPMAGDATFALGGDAARDEDEEEEEDAA